MEGFWGIIKRDVTIDLNGNKIISKINAPGEWSAMIYMDKERELSNNVIDFSIMNGELDCEFCQEGQYNIGIWAYGSNINITARGLTINMRGFKYTDDKKDSYGGRYGIVSNGSHQNVNIDIKRCKINNAHIGMYIPARGNSKTTVDSCNIYSGTGISAKGGSLDILNSEIHAYDNYVKILPGPNNNGSNPAAEALYIEGNYSVNCYP